MGTEKGKGIQFKQSVYDFPVMVKLGRDVPAWGLSRRASSGLRFLPLDDEGFTLRGNRQSLLYKGRKRSHRFTILGDTAFEYDCILNREPESNVVALRIEGAEHFDFFRQPDFLKDPLLAGSYAVYKKETLIGEGTGKLCHIHRPEIIDSRGRRVWGDLSVAGDSLYITIPEWWLSEASYPVIVDPVVGTSTVGSQNEWVEEEGEDPVDLYFELSIPVNRFLIPETINGTCEAYIYVNEFDYYEEDGGRAVLYSDNGNKPQHRKSMNESFIDFHSGTGNTKGWKSGTLQSNGSIAGGSSIWFGIFTEYFWFPRFDYGAKCYCNYWWDFDNSESVGIPDTYPLYNPNYYENFKLSMYFSYSSAQNYVRTLTQGVTLGDMPKRITNGKRFLAVTAQNKMLLGRAMSYLRKKTDLLTYSDFLNPVKGICLLIADTLNLREKTAQFRSLLRKAIQTVKAYAGTKRRSDKNLFVTDKAENTDWAGWGRGFLRVVHNTVKAGEHIFKVLEVVRDIVHTAFPSDRTGQWGEYVRGIMTEAGSKAEPERIAEYCRRQWDISRYHAPALRHLIITVKVFTTTLFRDYILRRFLVSKEELVLKSPVCRELIIDSRIH